MLPSSSSSSRFAEHCLLQEVCLHDAPLRALAPEFEDARECGWTPLTTTSPMLLFLCQRLRAGMSLRVVFGQMERDRCRLSAHVCLSHSYFRDSDCVGMGHPGVLRGIIDFFSLRRPALRWAKLPAALAEGLQP